MTSLSVVFAIKALTTASHLVTICANVIMMKVMVLMTIVMLPMLLSMMHWMHLITQMAMTNTNIGENVVNLHHNDDKLIVNKHNLEHNLECNADDLDLDVDDYDFNTANVAIRSQITIPMLVISVKIWL